MKTITFNADNRSIILTDDQAELVVETNHVKNGVQRIYGLTEDKVTLHENVTNVPEDWSPSKYLFDGTNWTENPNWVDPEQILNETLS